MATEGNICRKLRSTDVKLYAVVEMCSSHCYGGNVFRSYGNSAAFGSNKDNRRMRRALHMDVVLFSQYDVVEKGKVYLKSVTREAEGR